MPKTERFPRKIDILRYNEGIQANEVLSTTTPSCLTALLLTEDAL